METVAIRELSGEKITGATEILGVTSRGALVGVMVPWTSNILQHAAEQDAARHQEKVDQAEAEIASGRPMATLSELLGQSAQSQELGPGARQLSIRELSGARLEQAARDE